MSSTGTPNQRAFVGKRSKMTAADVRRHIMTGSVLVHPVSLDKPDGTSSALSLLDIVEPCDVEETLGQRKSAHRKVCEFPSDDIDVRLVDREKPTLDYPFINELNVKKVETHVKDILLSYSGKFSLVQRRHQQFGSAEAFIRMMMERPIIARTCAKPIFEFETGRSDRIVRSASLLVDNHSQESLSKRLSCASTASTGTMGSLEGELREPRLHLSHPDPIISGITQRTSYAVMDQQNDNKRQANRSSNLVNLLPLQNEEDVIERRSVSAYPEDRDSGQRLLVKVVKLNMEPLFEPIFGSICIYDGKMRRKASENFYFDVNSDSIRNMLKETLSYVGPHGRCNQASFNLNGNLSDFFMVIKLEKVLNACEVSDAVDPYCSQKDDRAREKLQIQAYEYCSRLGRYRMPMGFMIIDLQKVVNSAGTLERNEMTASTFMSGVSVTGDAPLASTESDTMSIMSVDRMSISSTSTFRRMGSGTSASTVLTRVRTPLQKRKNLGSDECVTNNEPLKISEAPISALQTFTLSLNSFFKYEGEKLSEDDLYKLLSEARKPGGKLSKLKTFPVDLVLQLTGSPGDDVPYKLSPEFLKVAPFNNSGSADLTKEVQDFSFKGQYSVCNSYKNLIYIYPKNVNFTGRQGTARNISIRVEMMNDKEVPQLVVFPNNAGTALNTYGQTTVIYHSKIPQMADEIKMALPVELDDGFHLLFTFYHISCKTGSKDEEFEYPIGYSWLPLYRDGKLSSGDFNLPICIERPPTSYGYLDPEGALPNIKWLDGHKPLFNVSICAESSVHPQDEHLEKFLVAVSSLSSTDKRRPPVSEEVLINSIRGILKARPEPLVAFLYNVLDKLILMISDTPFSPAVASACFETLGHLAKICTMLLDSCLDNHGRSSLLASYVHYFKISMKESSDMALSAMKISDKNRTNSPETQKLFNIIEGVERASNNKILNENCLANSCKLLHEELADLWIQSYGQAREMAFLNSWFLLELMLKSMAEYLSSSGRLYLMRRSRFGEKYLKLLESLSSAVITDMGTRLQKDARQAFSLGHSWAFFLRDAFSFMDRTFVMKLVKEFAQDITSRIVSSIDPFSTTLMVIKLDFIRIICSHEHFVILNLPFAQSSLSTSTSSSSVGTPQTQLQPPSPGGSSLSNRSIGTDSLSSFGYGGDQINTDFRRFHFLIGIVLSDLSAILEYSSSTLLLAKSIGNVRNLLATHEADNRLNEISVRSRVAALYFPLISIVMDNAPQLFDLLPRAVPFDRSRFSGDASHDSQVVDPKVALAIAGIGTQEATVVNPPPEKEKRARLNQELSRQLLTCFCWVLQHLDVAVLRQWIRDLPPLQLAQLIDILDLSVSLFDFNPVQQNQSQSALNSETTSLPQDNKNSVKWRKGVAVKVDAPVVTISDNEYVLEGLLCSEITLCVLEAYETVIRVVSMPGNDHLYFSISMVFRGMIHILSCNQAVTALENVFASLRALFTKFPEMIFEQETEQCGELCLQLLKHCASRLAPVRSQAAASLYLLMRESFDSGNSFARLKMQITMALSTLVSNGTRVGMWLNEDCLRRSLKTVLIYAETDGGSESIMKSQACFSEQVKDLIFNLHMILSDTVKMKEHANDFEMTLDLMYRVAKGYQNNPDLRLTWLLNMASRHAEKMLYCEAAECLLHASALASEYIAMTTTAGYLPRGAVEFQTMSTNILEESAVSDDVVSPETEGVCESRHFTASGLVQLIEKCASYFEKAQMYELLPDLFKVIDPILREWRDYRRLAGIHARLSDCLSRIEPTVSIIEDNSDAWFSPLPGSDKRCFGTYFRVGFYGARFGDLDGEEFIYKEPPFTKLSEVSSRLEAFYAERFGKDSVEVIKDSNNVSRASHQPNNVYLQITYVEPYFDKWERRRRPTHFERSHNLNRFSYATPFTRDGRAHGDLKDQCKRRTILTTQQSFPYVKTRIRVISREQKVLLPIQVAIEDIEKKTRELSAAIAQNPPDAKMLQMVLQGCIGTTVNQGPVQVANIFLKDITRDEKGKPIDKFQNKLRLSFKDFSKKCSDALALNKQLIQPDQQAYQNELQKNYSEFLKHMAPILESKKPTPSDKQDCLSVSLDLGPATEV